MTVTAVQQNWEYLDDDAEDLIEYVDRIAALLPGGGQKAPEDQDGRKPKKISGSPAPWDDRPAGLLFSMAADVRRIEGELRMRALGSVLLRSASDANTKKSIRAISDLAPVAAQICPGDDFPRHAARQVHEWGRKCRSLLDELRDDEQVWTRAPGDLKCPVQDEDGNYCDRDLWLAPGWRWVKEPPIYCRHCKDHNGDLQSWPTVAWIAVVTGQGQEDVEESS